MEEKSDEHGIKGFALELKRKIDEHFSSLSQPVLKNIVEIVIALVILLRTPKGWYGRLTLNGIARCMRTKGDPRVRYKRLDRFLKNCNFQPAKTIAGFLKLTMGEEFKGLLPILIDQSAIGDDSFLLTMQNLMMVLSSILRSSHNGLFFHSNLEFLKFR